MMHRLKYGESDIEFTVVVSNRKTLGITVHPDLSVVVKVPENTELQLIEQKVLKRAAWIQEQKRYFLSFEPRRKDYYYKSGETHYYLGRQYLLKIQTPTEFKKENPGYPHRLKEEVLYRGRYLLVITKAKTNREIVKQLLNQWYRERAKIKFAEIAEPLIQRFEKYKVAPDKIYIQEMPTRWGSCSVRNNITLNPQLIRAPKPCIEYVIVHELCHLVHRNHTKAFFALQQHEMPDWERWKEKLERFLA